MTEYHLRGFKQASPRQGLVGLGEFIVVSTAYIAAIVYYIAAMVYCSRLPPKPPIYPSQPSLSQLMWFDGLLHILDSLLLVTVIPEKKRRNGPLNTIALIPRSLNPKP